jgi:hypothetical protein
MVDKFDMQHIPVLQMFILDPGFGSASKILSIFNQKTVSKLFNKKRSGMFIPDPDFFKPIPDAGVKKHRIQDPDPQHRQLCV